MFEDKNKTFEIVNIYREDINIKYKKPNPLKTGFWSGSKNLYKYRTKQLTKIINKISFYFILINIFALIASKNSRITLKIEGSGETPIMHLCSDREYCGNLAKFTYPSKIEINGEEKTISSDYKFTFNKEKNNVTLIWENKAITNLNYIFYDCDKIVEMDLSNFDSSQVTTMSSMFYFCESLRIINLSNLNTSNVGTMFQMFSNCRSLESLDLSSFDVSNVYDFQWMFANCHSLTSLNLSNFKTPKVEITYGMFIGCINLHYIDLSYFDTSHITNMAYMFYDCSSLISLDLDHFNTINIQDIESMFERCSSLISLNLSNFNYNYSNYIKMNRIFYDCFSLKELDISNFNISKITAPLSIISSNIFIYGKNKIKIDEYLNQCTPFIICSKYNFKDIENITLNEIKLYFNCTNYNLKINDTKKICNTNYYILYNESNFNYIYNNYFHIQEQKKPDENINVNNTNISENINVNNTNVSEILINKIKNLVNNFNEKELINVKEIKYKIEQANILIILTTTDNEKNKENKNLTSINLDKCEEEIRNEYDIKNHSIYIIKIEKHIDGMKIPKIEYELYCCDENGKLVYLNITFLKNCEIYLTIPVIINDSIEKYYPTSNYYNNICSKATSKNKTDISIPDRRKEFINKNMFLCEENCKFINYDEINKKVKCSCLIKIKLPLFDDIIFDKDKFYKSFKDLKNIGNINIMKCYKNVFDKSLKNNYGFFIFIFIILIYLICLFLFYFRKKEYISIIKEIVMAKIKLMKIRKNNELLTGDTRKIKKNKKNKKKKLSMGLNKNFPHRKNKKLNSDSDFKNSSVNKLNKKEYLKETIETKAQNKTKKSKIRKISESQIENKNNKDLLKYKKILEENINELNTLSYQDALIKDHRTYISYYISLIKNGNPFIFSFFKNNDYNSTIIKKFLFFFFFSLHFTVNALFFTDSTMGKIYEDEGKFNFIYQIPQIFISFCISTFINNIVKYLSLQEKDIIKLKQEKNISIVKPNSLKLISSIKTKILFFFIITFILLLTFFYYITCFCGIYKNTHYQLIKDTIISFVLSLIYPFIIYLIPGIFRKCALNSKKANRACLYIISKIIQLF